MATRDIEIIKGDSYTHLVTFVDETGTPIDLTGYTALAYIRRVAASTGPADAEFSVTIDPLVGEVLLDLTATQTELLSVVQCGYSWDLELTNGDLVTTPLRGKVTVLQDVTHP